MNPSYKKSFFSVLLLLVFASLNFSFPEPSNDLIDDKARKTKHCKQILKELATVSGLSSIEIPDIEVVDPLKNQSLAIAMFYDEGNPTIQVHEWTYDICMSLLGRDSINGLVFIIAHELAHLLKKHEERPLYEQIVKVDSNDVIGSSKTKEIIKRSKMDVFIRSFRDLSSTYNIRKNEAEADLHAGFTAYLAGYDTRRAAVIFFDSTYKYFKLDTEKGKYISKEERKIIVEGTAKQLDTLIQVFEMANLLTISGSYEVATHCYKYINKHYSNPTLLNNIGLTLILETLDWFPMDLNYYLPLTINTSFAKTDIVNDGVGGGLRPYELTNEDLINKLNSSIRYFKEIQLTHPSHYEAHLNESIANFLISVINDDQESLIFAKASAYQAKKILEKKENIDNKTMADVYCMLAIIEDRYANYEQASKLFNEAKNYNPTNYLIELNSDIGLKNKDQTSTTSSQKIEIFSVFPEQPLSTLKLDSFSNSNCAPDTISNNYQSLSDMYSEAKAPWILNLDLGQGNFGMLHIKIKSFPESILYAAISEGVRYPQAQQYILEYKQDSQQLSDCGIKIGDSWVSIKELYGNKPKLLLSNSGNYLNYFYIPKILGRNTHGTIFYTKNNLVKKWYKYEHQEVNFYVDDY